ncbi:MULTISPECIES: hypothetical protein [unclassified Rhodococcus (in: high G+C Gram-positive bacteria)]|uniref:hypothetical protein n=1 Tax=unclassified Rhodococcus (in: high G+C Gram-positive bacteria) TaxID=192944 RepID=UPI00163966B6|nr:MULTISPECIES: hypothetical protein [unclassified Rhodococcus (in: high G+C Gram-positive bacteria)]MBC2640549.1 hypothetical protein [Rhodococcus sp. 3A]MBC2894705.1 hypothetical protein [Rhodococcus sp. 4CII]
MTTGTVRIQRAPDGVRIIAPDGAPSVLDATAGIDVAVLEVRGGHLSWTVLADSAVPAAVIDDVDSAQNWVWAVFGEEVALALAAGSGNDVTAGPARPRIAAAARRLAFAQWATRWWPASTVDAIPALDAGLLNREIGTLAEDCDLLVDGDDALAPAGLPVSGLPGRADDYALAAGAATAAVPSRLVLARGAGGTDWRRYPPGLVDASERAVFWEVARAAGTTSVRVSIVAAPSLSAVPDHLRPWATVGTAAGTVDVALQLSGDAWFGESAAPRGSEAGVSVGVYVPGFGVDGSSDGAGPEARQRVRNLVRQRLRRAAETTPDDGPDAPLLAEIDAAASDPDF